MSVATCYLCRAEGKEHTAVITLRDRGEREGGMLQVANDKWRSGSDTHSHIYCFSFGSVQLE